jgi:hypothetical protein
MESRNRRRSRIFPISPQLITQRPEAACPRIDNERSSGTSTAAPIQTSPLNPDQIRRTIAFVVDDLGPSLESVARLRDALRRFVDAGMQPDDMVAIVRSGDGLGVLQQFTTDQEVLHAAVASIKFNMGRVDVTSFAR